MISKKRVRSVFIIAVLVVTSIFLSSCGMLDKGNKRITEEKFTSQIKEGETGKAKVKEILGEPETVVKGPGKGETWSYSYKKADSTCSCGGISWTKRREPQFLTIIFSDAGIVKSVTKE